MMPRIPTAISKPEATYMRRVAEGRRVVECGALLGFSTLQLAQTAASLTSIDRHAGYGPGTERAFRSNLAVYSPKPIDVVVGDARELVDGFAGDIAFLDLDGTEQTTAAVLSRVRTPWVLVHDLGRQRCAGVERAIQRAGFSVVEAVDTLALCRRRFR